MVTKNGSKKSRGFAPLLILLAIAVVGLVLLAYRQISSRTTPTPAFSPTASGLNPQEIDRRLTAAQRQCLISQLGRTQAAQLIQAVRLGQAVSPQTITQIKNCLPPDLLPSLSSQPGR